jgi:hypothetical protein
MTLRGSIIVAVLLLFAGCHNKAELKHPQPTPDAIAKTAASVPKVAHVFVVILENEDADDAARQPFLSELASRGALLVDYHGITHPSQPNYIALVSGSTLGVRSDVPANVDAQHLGDLLDERGLSWKSYAEKYPGGCFLGSKSGSSAQGEYVRRHVPFLSFANIQHDETRCSTHIVEASELDRDIAAGTLPRFSFYVPDNQHNGHDSNVTVADRWLRARFAPLLADPRFNSDLLFIVTFDESSKSTRHNPVATILLSPRVVPGIRSDHHYDHYNLLRTIEAALDLGTMGKNDATAEAISGIWQ